MPQKTYHVGDKAPLFTLPNANGQPIALADLLAKGPVVLFFYPKDHTPGCTAEACAFRDQYEIFAQQGASVVGISADSAESHNSFAQQHSLPFLLLSDTQKTVQKLFGVPRTWGLFAGRVTYVINQQGVICHVFNSQLQAQKHVQEALVALQNL